MDLDFASYFPIAGYTWISNLKFFKDHPNDRYKKLLYCMTYEVSATD